jgi:hypothetical protein
VTEPDSTDGSPPRPADFLRILACCSHPSPYISNPGVRSLRT